MDFLKLDKVTHIDPSMYELFPPPLGDNYILQQIDAAIADHHKMRETHYKTRENVSPSLGNVEPPFTPTPHTAGNDVQFFLNTELIKEEGKAPYLRTTAYSVGGVVRSTMERWLKGDF